MTKDRKTTKRISAKREKQTRYLSQAIQLEEAVNPHIIRATMTMISLALLSFLLWAGFTNINEVARTPGEVVPQGYQQTVQHLEGGMIKKINVQEGQVVKKGEGLITLDDASIKEDMQRAKSKQLSLTMQAERLRAFVQGREPDFAGIEGHEERITQDQIGFFNDMREARKKEAAIVRNQIAQKKQAVNAYYADLQTARGNLDIASDMYRRRQTLNQKGYTSDMQLLEDRRRMNDLEGEIKRLNTQIMVNKAEIAEFEGRLASLSASHIDNANEKLDIVLAEIAQNAEIIDKLNERIGRLEIRSPAQGLVKGLNVNTIGAVIQPGQTLMEIVPMDEVLEVQVKISPKDIGHVKAGQTVQVKFSSYDFSRYGSVQGTLDQISATTFSDDQGGRYYQGRVHLDKAYVGHNRDNMIIPGMTVMADVITGEKTILQYLLKPIHVSLKTAFSER